MGNLSKLSTETDGKKKFQIDIKLLDVKAWFKCYDAKISTMFDHIVMLEQDDMDSWSVSTGSTASTESGTTKSSPSRHKRTGSMDSTGSVDGVHHNFIIDHTIKEETEEELKSNKLSATNLAALGSRLSRDNLASLAEQLSQKI